MTETAPGATQAVSWPGQLGVPEPPTSREALVRAINRAALPMVWR